MSETHRIAGAARAEPLPAGRVGARVHVPLSGTPSPRWSRALTAHLTNELTGHDAVGHLHVRDVVQGAKLVLEGVEEREAPALGACVQRAVEAANRGCARDEGPEATNMSQREADEIARLVEFERVTAPA
jgi:hypothetical protein